MRRMIIEYLRKFGHASPRDIDSLLYNMLLDILSLEQKKNKVKNLLQEMAKKDQTIYNAGGRAGGAMWKLKLD